MTTPTFTSVPVDELPSRVRTATISDIDKANATAVATILASGQAARSSAEFTEKRKATDAGVRLSGIIRRLATADQGFPYHGKMGVVTISLSATSWTFAVRPKVDEPAPDATTETATEPTPEPAPTA